MPQTHSPRNSKNGKIARPFLKWVGGKRQLLDKFERFFPAELKEGKIAYYFEPFLGGGAVFFHLKQKYKFKAHLSDINEELISLYKIIKNNRSRLVFLLKRYSNSYLKLPSARRKIYFYQMRNKFNCLRQIPNKQSLKIKIEKAALMVFLNKTCYNGLFRMNGKGNFNTPHGRYKFPKIVDAENLINVSKVLKKVNLAVYDFTSLPSIIEKLKKHAAATFVYFDPPYRPLNSTASFTAYHKNDFDDEKQKKLAEIFNKLDSLGVKVMLSNSDPKNENKNDNFFEEHYKNVNFYINRVTAKRVINSVSERRGIINELVITNYKPADME